MSRTTKHEIATVDELGEHGACVIEEIDGIEVAVFNINGEYHAIANFCPHQSGPLCEGDLKTRIVPGEDGWEWGYDSENKYILCPWHGWQFDVTTGRNTDDTTITVPKFDVTTQNDTVYIER